MPVDLKNRPKEVKEARSKIIQDLTRLAGHQCEITGKHGNTDCHEFWVTSKESYDDDVAIVLLTHPANIIVINHNLHINQRSSFETCLKVIRNRRQSIWNHFGFANYYDAILDFRNKIIGFYQTGQIKVPVSFIPKNK